MVVKVAGRRYICKGAVLNICTMDKGKFFSGLAIMLGLVVMGSMLPKAVEKYRSYDRTVNVKGLCEKEVKADRVIWPIVYKVMANDIQSVYDQIDAGNDAVLSFLQSGGVNASEITVAVPQISDKFANEYGDNDRAFRYIAKNVITVYTSDVDLVLSLMDRQSELMKKGVVTGGNSWENPVEFKYEGLNDIKPPDSPSGAGFCKCYPFLSCNCAEST